MTKQESPWIDVSDDFDRESQGERWFRPVSSNCWISVLHRMTGFGYMEWETAMCWNLPVEGRARTWEDRRVLIIGGDRRDELATMPEDQLAAWYYANIEGNRNSMETFIETAKDTLPHD